MEYRNTPIDASLNKSPSQLVFGRSVNGFMPTVDDINENLFIEQSYKEVKWKLQDRQEKYEVFHDRTFTLHYREGEVVYVKDNVNHMTPAQIVGDGENPRSYKLSLPSGNVVYRNRFGMYKSALTDKFEVESGNFGCSDNGYYDNSNGKNSDTYYPRREGISSMHQGIDLINFGSQQKLVVRQACQI